MKIIPLTKNKHALVDDEDYEYLNQWKWYANSFSSRNTEYAERTDTSGKNIGMHRVIMQSKDGEEVDHWDGNGLNNQRYNLRKTNHQKNIWNSCKHKNNTSGYKGVRKLTKKSNQIKPWQARIKVNYKEIFLGNFSTSEEAGRAYDQAAKLYFGEFARLNFPNLE